MDITNFDINSIVTSFLVGGGTAAAVVWLAKKVITERVRGAISHEYATKLEAHKSQLQEAMGTKLEAYKAEVRAQELVTQDRWSIKRDACLAALDVVDRALTNMDWEIPGLAKIPPEEVKPCEARAAMNRLAMTCDNPEVVRLFLRCLNARVPEDQTPPLSGDTIQDLRRAVRRELGFGNDLNIDRRLAWIASIPKKT